MDTKNTQVVIAGGGIAGSSLACALAHRGIYSVMIEKRRTPTDLNRGDGMQPRSLEIMEQWGMLAAYEQAGALRAYGIEIHHPVLGKLLEIDLSRVQAPHPHLLNLPHRDIETLLLDHARRSGYCQIYYGNVNEVLFENDQAVGVKALVDGQTLEVRAPVVAAADGAQSALRKKAGIEVSFHEYEHDLLVFHAKRPASLTGRPMTRVFMHREGAIILLPLPQDRVRIAVLIEGGTGGQWKTLSEDALRQRLAGRLPLMASLEGLERHGEHIYRMRNMHTPHYAQRGIVLLGDAAHVTHAAGGLGMNMALQDADTLAEELASVFQGDISLPQAYLNYERIRRPINQSVIERADFMSRQLWTPSRRGFLTRSLSLALPRYLLPFVSRRITTSLAWRNAGIPLPAEQKRAPFPVIYSALYRFSRGKFGGRSRQNAVLLLTTHHKSGKEHTVPLLYFPQGERLAVVASHGGADLPPDWLINLRRDPHATIQVGARKLQVAASVASQEERNRLWPSLTSEYPGLADYQQKTTRQIEVVFLQTEEQANSEQPVPLNVGSAS